MTALILDPVSTLVQGALSYDPRPLRTMTALRLKQVYRAFHGCPTMTLLGYKDAPTVAEFVDTNDIALVTTDHEMVSEIAGLM